MSVFVCDGYDKKGKIEAAPGLWPEFTFVYRPALPEEVYRLGSNPAPEKIFKFLAEHMKSWDADDQDPTEDRLKKVYHGIVEQLITFVTGYTATDWEADLKN